MEAREFVGLAGIPLIQALVALIKTTCPGLSARYYPAVSLTIGVALNLALAYLLEMDYGLAVLVGTVAGLGASRLFEYGKNREMNYKLCEK